MNSGLGLLLTTDPQWYLGKYPERHSFSLYTAHFEFLCTCSWLGSQVNFRAVPELGLKVVTVQSLQSLLSALLVVVAQRIEPVGCMQGGANRPNTLACLCLGI